VSKVCAEDGYILVGVQGGSLSEGVDYENNALKCVIIVGIPLEEMNMEVKARIEYYDKVFGKGWEYGYVGPAITKSLQAAGRAIRNADDRAVIVFLDERFGWKGYKEYLGNVEKMDYRKISKFWNDYFEGLQSL
jgi:DNA excision repair protein ERCC-2